MGDRRGKVLTVTGLVDPSSLGVTLTHEHLALDATKFFHEPNPEFRAHADLPYTLENYGWIHRNAHRDNLKFYPEEKEAIMDEIKLFKTKGGGAIVENSNIGLERDVNFLKRVSEETGVKIIAGTGYFLDSMVSSTVRSLSVEALADDIRQDILKGADDTDVKCGVIGEIGCSNILTAFEKRSIQAGAEVQTELGCPVIIHPGRPPDCPTEIIRIFQEAGGDVTKTVMSHLDRTFLSEDDDQLLEFAKLGCFCEYDFFGTEAASYPYHPGIYMMNDGERLRKIRLLMREGHLHQVVISHDVCAKHNLLKFGGPGYSHILRTVVPMMLKGGFDRTAVDQILIENPKRWLTFDK